MKYRFYVDQTLEDGIKVTLSEEEYHHAHNVLRVRPGVEIEIVNGMGALGHALFNKSLQILSVHNFPPPEYKKILIQACPEPSHLEFIVEKGTELGITDFYIFSSEKSSFKMFGDAKKARLKKITIAAFKQCKRLFLPSLTFSPCFNEIPFPTNLLLADPAGGPFTKINGDTAFIVGPESGFTPSEINTFKVEKKAKSIKLSDNILRCETAAIVASSLL